MAAWRSPETVSAQLVYTRHLRPSHCPNALGEVIHELVDVGQVQAALLHFGIDH